jgi:hypothetical protein
MFTGGTRTVSCASPDARRKGVRQPRTSGQATNHGPLELAFTATREGYHQLAARLGDSAEQPTRAYVKVEYEAPARSELIEP